MAQQALVAYLRVSTTKQGIDGLSIETQRAVIADFAKQRGIDVIAEYAEVVSGKKVDREELAKAIAHCRKRNATLAIAKLDRLSRSVSFIANLVESDVNFVICDNPNANKMTIQMLSVFAEYERDMISTRTREALLRSDKIKAKVEKRKDYDKQMLELFAELKSEGIESMNGIAMELMARGIQTRTGGTNWTATGVRNIFIRN